MKNLFKYLVLILLIGLIGFFGYRFLNDKVEDEIQTRLTEEFAKRNYSLNYTSFSKQGTFSVESIELENVEVINNAFQLAVYSPKLIAHNKGDRNFDIEITNPVISKPNSSNQAGYQSSPDVKLSSNETIFVSISPNNAKVSLPTKYDVEQYGQKMFGINSISGNPTYQTSYENSRLTELSYSDNGLEVTASNPTSGEELSIVKTEPNSQKYIETITNDKRIVTNNLYVKLNINKALALPDAPFNFENLSLISDTVFTENISSNSAEKSLNIEKLTFATDKPIFDLSGTVELSNQFFFPLASLDLFLADYAKLLPFLHDSLSESAGGYIDNNSYNKIAAMNKEEFTQKATDLINTFNSDTTNLKVKIERANDVSEYSFNELPFSEVLKNFKTIFGSN